VPERVGGNDAGAVRAGGVAAGCAGSVRRWQPWRAAAVSRGCRTARRAGRSWC
jgi:hypothetical protein